MANRPKTPKWQADWDVLVGDYEYFAIKNWEKYQALTSAGIPVAQWIKDFVEKDFEEAELSALERWLLDSLRRWRGRRGSNIPTNLTAILSATCAYRKDRPHVPHALLTLTARGFLVPCNQRGSVLKKIQEDLRREETQEKTSSAGAGGQQNKSKSSRSPNGGSAPGKDQLDDSAAAACPECGAIPENCICRKEDEVQLPKSKVFEVED